MNKFDLIEEKTILELTNLMEKGTITSRELVLGYLRRISEIDKSGPCLNSIREVNPDAVSIAEVRDEQRKNGEIMGPLHGIPVVVKDTIDSGDNMHTTAGAIALKDHYADEDAFVIKQLKKAGAIILGKANLSEWANFFAIGMPHGYSSLGGRVLNPYKPIKRELGGYEVGGSSTGSAIAASANLAACGIGTETSGSIIMPAALSSCVGIKPTMGLISRSGVIPLAASWDTVGPICRTVEDAALVLTILCGEDENDPSTYFAKEWEGTDYTKFLNKDGLKGKRLGFLRDVYFEKLDEEGKEIIEKTLDLLRDLGAEIVDPVEDFLAAKAVPTFIASEPGPDELNINVLYHEFKVGLNQYLSKLEDHLPVHSLSELIEFNVANKDIALKYGQAHLEKTDKTDGTLTSLEYINARMNDERVCGVESIDKAMDNYNLDALIYPHYFAQTVGARVGYPSINVPAGYSKEEGPISLTFLARKFEEPKLIELAYSFEQNSKVRKAPKFD